MLEEQQSWLAHGLQVLYRLVCDGESRRRGSAECIETDQPAILDLLARLGFLHSTQRQFSEETADIVKNSTWQRQQEVLQYLDVSDGRADTSASQRRNSPPQSVSPSSDQLQPSMTRNALTVTSSSGEVDTLSDILMPNSVDWANNGFGACDDSGLLSDEPWAHASLDFQTHSLTMEEIPPMEWGTTNLVGERSDYGDIWQFVDAGAETTSDS